MKNDTVIITPADSPIDRHRDAAMLFAGPASGAVCST
jgi:hypothetical protein